MTAPLPSPADPIPPDSPAKAETADVARGAEVVPASAPSRPIRVHVLRPVGRWVPLDLRELWDYRDLLFIFTWRDIKVRYKQTVLGAAWALIQPLLMVVVFTVIFQKLAKIPSDGVPYPLFALAALLPWQLFARSLTECSNSLLASAHLLTKVYFPRLIIPMVSIASGLVDFVIALALLAALLVAYGAAVPLQVLTLPLFAALAVATALGFGLWFAALNIKYRDVRHVVPFVIQLWMYASPIVYPASLVPQKWRSLYALNPMVGVAEGFRWALFDRGSLDVGMLAISSGIVALTLISGIYYFRRMEHSFADVA
jgi:lipopolysaccharide transport system permease protein